MRSRVYRESRFERYRERARKLLAAFPLLFPFFLVLTTSHLDASSGESFQVTAQAALEMVKLMMEIASKKKYVGEGNFRYRTFGEGLILGESPSSRRGVLIFEEVFHCLEECSIS